MTAVSWTQGKDEQRLGLVLTLKVSSKDDLNRL